MSRLRNIIEGAVVDLAAALIGRRAVAAANVQVDRLRATFAATLGFEDIPPDADLEAALRKRVARISDLEQRWAACSRRVHQLGEQNVALAFEADRLHRELQRLHQREDEREHQLAVAREKLRNGDVQGADHYLWTVTRPAIGSEPVEGGGLVDAGALPGEEVGDVG